MTSRPENMGDIESLLRSNDASIARWYPTPVATYDRELRYGKLSNMYTSFRSNIAYSLQYLEFLERQLAELKLSSVIESLVIKNYIITSAAIIEIIFYHIAKETGKLKKRMWSQGKLQDIKNLPPKDGRIQKLSQMIQTKLDTPVIDTPTFETLISIVRDNRLLNDIDINAWNRYFKTLRELRNKVHLTCAIRGIETDYWSFTRVDYLRAKYVLYKILTDRAIGNESQEALLGHLEVAMEQIAYYKSKRIIKIE